MNTMMSRWRQRRRSSPAMKLWPTKLLQLLRRSGHHQYYISNICYHQLNRIHLYHQHFQCDVAFFCTFSSYSLSSSSSPFTKKHAIFTTIATTKTTSNISRDDCENDLAEAIPALQSAINSLNTLKPSDITVVRNIVHILLFCEIQRSRMP